MRPRPTRLASLEWLVSKEAFIEFPRFRDDGNDPSPKFVVVSLACTSKGGAYMMSICDKLAVCVATKTM
eukprot:SAG31_NODE_134_length_23213_cov_5.698624_10_plen_69_part_00